MMHNEVMGKRDLAALVHGIQGLEASDFSGNCSGSGSRCRLQCSPWCEPGWRT